MSDLEDFFDDIFDDIEDLIGTYGLEALITSLTSAGSGDALSQIISSLGMAGVLDENTSTRLTTGILSPLSAANQTLFDPRQSEKFLDKTKEFFSGKDLPAMPRLGNALGIGGRTLEAKEQARDEAIAEAGRVGGLGLSGTVTTSPLGLQGDTSIAKKTLVGE